MYKFQCLYIVLMVSFFLQLSEDEDVASVHEQEEDDDASEAAKATKKKPKFDPVGWRHKLMNGHKVSFTHTHTHTHRHTYIHNPIYL